jgi:aryl-alcohol dehydrogenase-like predicted oxidoreductase
VALAWVTRRSGVTAPIASATSLAQLRELIAATQLSLDAESVRVLDNASAP